MRPSDTRGNSRKVTCSSPSIQTIVRSGTVSRRSLRRPEPRILPPRKRRACQPRVPTPDAGHARAGVRATTCDEPDLLPAHAQELCREVLRIEPQDTMPHVLGRRGAIARPIIREESVTGVTIHPKFIGFSVLVEFFLQSGCMRR